MTGEQESDADARTEALEDLATAIDDLRVIAFFFMMTAGFSALAFLGYLEKSSAVWLVYPMIPSMVLIGFWGLNMVADCIRKFGRVVNQYWRGGQAQNQSNTSDGNMDSTVNLNEQEESV